MLGMAFSSFFTLLIVGLIAALVLHYAVGYRMLPRFDGFIAKWVVAWVAAWVGSPVLGHWGFVIANVYVIPAIVAAFAGTFVATACFKASALAVSPAKEQTSEPAVGDTRQLEMRKAG